MIALHLAAAAAVFIWATALIIAHLERARTMDWCIEPISAYLTGRAGDVVDAGFYVLAVGLLCLAATVSLWPAAFYVFAALGTAGACVTRAVWPDDEWHYISAGAAYLGIGVGNILAGWPDPILRGIALAAVAVALVNVARRSSGAIQEKTVAAVYMVSIWAMTVHALL